MAIYKMANEKRRLDKIKQTTFGQEGVLERADLQRILRDQPDVLEDGLLIISEEFGNWQDSKRRIDLLGLDSEGKLVVVELKRGESGEHMDLQAIRYAAMVANMTSDEVVNSYQVYLSKRAKEVGATVEEDEAENRIRQHLKDSQDISTEMPRIILAAEDFGKELTTCVLWLNDSWLRNEGQEIKCIRLQAHKNNNEVLIETSVIIPLLEASTYTIQRRKREQETGTPQSRNVERIPGASRFKESIDIASYEFRSGLQQLYDCAIGLEEEGLVKLSSLVRGNGDIVELFLEVTNLDVRLVSFSNLARYKGKECGGEVIIWPNEHGLASKSFPKFDDAVGPVTSKNGMRHRRLSRLQNLERVLAIIQEVHRELRGE